MKKPNQELFRIIRFATRYPGWHPFASDVRRHVARAAKLELLEVSWTTKQFRVPLPRLQSRSQEVHSGLKFHINAHGDRTVGDGDHYAIVEIPYAPTDKEYIDGTRECLQDSFRKIFDARNVRVLTDEEYRKEEEMPDG